MNIFLRSLLITLLISPTCVMAGTVVYQNMYTTNSFLVGEGLTPQEAAIDAFSAMPAGYISDRKNSQYVECSVTPPQEGYEEEGVLCDLRVSGNYYRLIQPIVLAEKQSQSK